MAPLLLRPGRSLRPTHHCSIMSLLCSNGSRQPEKKPALLRQPRQPSTRTAALGNGADQTMTDAIPPLGMTGRLTPHIRCLMTWSIRSLTSTLTGFIHGYPCYTLPGFGKTLGIPSSGPVGRRYSMPSSPPACDFPKILASPTLRRAMPSVREAEKW